MAMAMVVVMVMVPVDRTGQGRAGGLDLYYYFVASGGRA